MKKFTSICLLTLALAAAVSADIPYPRCLPCPDNGPVVFDLH